MTVARKGALMSKSDVRTFYIVLAISPPLIWFFADTALRKGAEGSWEEYLCWAFVGLFASGLLTIPMTLYGYHNRHRIDVGDEQPHDLTGVHKAAIAGAAAVPILRMIQEWISG
ncbi:MAG: hypothetical protein AAF543_07565 [Pseudomonadota bacterium]